MGISIFLYQYCFCKVVEALSPQKLLFVHMCVLLMLLSYCFLCVMGKIGFVQHFKMLCLKDIQNLCQEFYSISNRKDIRKVQVHVETELILCKIQQVGCYNSLTFIYKCLQHTNLLPVCK